MAVMKWVLIGRSLIYNAQSAMTVISGQTNEGMMTIIK